MTARRGDRQRSGLWLRRLLWLFAIWLLSVAAVASVGFALRLWLAP